MVDQSMPDLNDLALIGVFRRENRPSGAANEPWDLLVYGNAALDLIAWNYCATQNLEYTNWAGFWDDCLERKLFFAE